MELSIDPFYIGSAELTMFPILPGSAKREMPWGKPDKGNPIFFGAKAEKISLIERFETVSQRLTGAPFPRPRQRGAHEHEIRIQQVWLTQPDDADSTITGDWILVRDALYVMLLTWQEDPPKDIEECRWHSRVYYGVCSPSVARDATTDTVAFTDDKPLTAMFYRAQSGVGEIPPL
jgi:hypothetical protein